MALSIKVETIYSADIRIGGDDLNGYFINVEPPDGEPFWVEHLQVEDLIDLRRAIDIAIAAGDNGCCPACVLEAEQQEVQA